MYKFFRLRFLRLVGVTFIYYVLIFKLDMRLHFEFKQILYIAYQLITLVCLALRHE